MRRGSYKEVKIASENVEITQKTICFVDFMRNCRLQYAVQKHVAKKLNFQPDAQTGGSCCESVYEYVTIIIDKLPIIIDGSVLSLDGV